MTLGHRRSGQRKQADTPGNRRSRHLQRSRQLIKTEIARKLGLDILHPYYDNVENDRWLAATVIEGNPPAFRFEVCAPDTWSAALAERARLHFATFALGALYAQQAARELSGIKFRLEGILSQQGADGVRLHVLENERSWRAARLNGWQSAFYGAGAASDWFCAGGFRF